MRENFRYFAILDGASIANEDVASDPQYFGYTRPGGSWVIMRYTSSSGVYDYLLGIDLDRSMTSYDTAWTNRASQNYIKAGNLKSL